MPREIADFNLSEEQVEFRDTLDRWRSVQTVGTAIDQGIALWIGLPRDISQQR